MRRVHLLLFLLIAVILAFNPAYTLFAIMAKGSLPAAAINLIKYTPYLLLLATLLGASWYRFKADGLEGIKKAPIEVKVAMALLVWSTITVLFSSASTWQSLRGINVDFAGLILFLSIWLLQPDIIHSRRLKMVMLITLVALAVLAIPEALWNTDYRKWAGHPLDNHYVTGTIPQLRSLTSGPNPFGTLMILLSVLVVSMVGNRTVAIIAMVPIGVLFGLTYARSAWIGAGVMGGGLFFYLLAKYRRWVVWPLVLGCSILLGAGIGAVTYHESIINVLTHGKSTEEHGQTAQEALHDTYEQSVPQTIFGHGMGTAGPVVFDTPEEKKHDTVKIVESWYIQLVQEIGLIGLALYLWLYLKAGRLLWRRDLVIGFLALGLGINAITLHIWSADSNLNLMFWTLAALTLYQTGKQKKA